MDWRGVAGNGLWILGLSVLMAACSYYNWLAVVLRRSRREVLTESLFRAFSSLALVLILIGLAVSQTDRWWERAFCVGIALSFAWDFVRLMQRRKIGLDAGRSHCR